MRDRARMLRHRLTLLTNRKPAFNNHTIPTRNKTPVSQPEIHLLKIHVKSFEPFNKNQLSV